MEVKVQTEEKATPEQLDQLLEAKPKDQANIVQRLQQNTDKFINKVANYNGSRKQLQVVLASLAIHPFNERPFQFSYPEQKELFELGVMVNSDKLMFLHLGIEEQKLAKEIKERTTPPAFTIEETGLFMNGKLFDSSFTNVDGSRLEKVDDENWFVYKNDDKYALNRTGFVLLNKENENGRKES